MPNWQHGYIKIVKNTVGGNGNFNFTATNTFSGSAGLPTSFNIITSGGTGYREYNVTTIQHNYTMNYSVTETVPSDWTLTSATCDYGSSPSHIHVPCGGIVTCTFTNTKVQPANIIVIKHVVNTYGGSATANAFTMNVANSKSPASFPGAESPGTLVAVNPGSYTVTESGPSGYSSSFSSDCSGTAASGVTKTCTVTNHDLPASSTSSTSTSTSTSTSSISTSTSSISTSSTTTAPTTTVQQSSGGGVVWSGAAGGGSGTHRPTTSQSGGCYLITNMTEFDYVDLLLSNQDFRVTENFIGPTSAGVTIGDNSYTLYLNTTAKLSTTGGPYSVNLLNISYLPLQHTIALKICRAPPSGAPSNISFSNSPSITLEILTSACAGNLSIKNVSNFPLLRNYDPLSIFNISCSSTTTNSIDVLAKYSCSIPSNSISPFVLENNGWKPITPFAVNSSMCTLEFAVPNHSTASIMQFITPVPLVPLNATNSSTTTVSVITPTTIPTTSQSSSAINWLLLIAVIIIIAVTIYYLIIANRRKKAEAE